MPLFVINNNLVVFSHIPKAGGSSMELYLQKRFGTLNFHVKNNKRSLSARRRSRDINCSPQHFTAQTLEILFPNKPTHSFTIVRNPLDRIVSEYKFQQGKSRIGRFNFSTWLRIALGAAQRDSRIFDNHIRPQIDFIYDGMKVFKLEDGFEQVYAYIDKICGSSGKFESFHIKKRIGSAKIYREDVELICKFYREDFENFDYSLPEFHAYPRDRFLFFRSMLARAVSEALFWSHRCRFGRAPLSSRAHEVAV